MWTLSAESISTTVDQTERDWDQTGYVKLPDMWSPNITIANLNTCTHITCKCSYYLLRLWIKRVTQVNEIVANWPIPRALLVICGSRTQQNSQLIQITARVFQITKGRISEGPLYIFYANLYSVVSFQFELVGAFSTMRENCYLCLQFFPPCIHQISELISPSHRKRLGGPRPHCSHHLAVTDDQLHSGYTCTY